MVVCNEKGRCLLCSIIGRVRSIIMRHGRRSEATEAVYCPREKNPHHTGVRTGCHFLIRLCVHLCVTFVVCTHCENCTRPISTNSGSMDAGEHGLTRGMWVFARRLEVVAVAGMVWVSWLVLVWARIVVLFMRSHLQIRGPREVSV